MIWCMPTKGVGPCPSGRRAPQAEKDVVYTRLRRLSKHILLLVAFSSFIAFNAWAEDALTTLQRDVILAKEKREAITGKLDSVNGALDKTKEKAVEKKPEKKSLTAAPVAKKENIEIKTLPSNPEVKTVSAPNKNPWQWPKFDFFPKTFPYNQKVTDGEMLFRVAISDNKLTLHEVTEIGLANNMQLRAAKKNIEVADARFNEAKRGLFPTVQATTDINGGKVTSRFYRGDSQKLNVAQPLYYGGELTNTVKQAEENLLVAKTEYKKSYNEFIHQLRVSYYSVVKAEYNKQYQTELFGKVNQLLQKLKQQREQKLVPEVDYLNVESQYYQVLYQMETSKNDVLSANVSLKQLMNLETPETLPLDLKIDYVKLDMDFNELLARAFENNADVRVKTYALEAAKYGIEIYESKKKPHFELRGSYGMLGEAFQDDRRNPTHTGLSGDTTIDTEKEWFLGIHGSMPIGTSSIEYDQIKHVYGPTVLALTGSEDWRHHVAFNLFDKLNGVTDEKSAQYAYLQAQNELQTAKNDVTLRLRDNYYDLQKYLIQIDSSTSKLRYQEKQSAILEYLMSLQETTPSNYVQNLVERAQDQYAFIQGVADYNTALSSISLLIGDPDYFEDGPLLEKLKQGKKNEIQGTQRVQV